jgi:hypothetical protein
MKPMIRMTAGALAVLALAGCSKVESLTAPPPRSGNANYGTYVALGTSVSAGYQSGGLVDRHQLRSFPVDFAKQAGSRALEIPSVNGDGIPPLLEIKSLSPLVIDNTGRTPGAPTNAALPRPYDNLAVPGAILVDLTSTSRYGGGYFPLIVRSSGIPGTLLDQAASLQPTFLSIEFGANEVLGPSTQGSGTPLLSPLQFAGLLAATLDSVAVLMPNAKVAILNVPEVTSLPFFTTLPRVLDPGGNCVVLGTGGPLQPGDLVLLTAAGSLATGTGVPALCGGNDNPLPDNLVLTAAEAAGISAAVAAYNAAIASEAAARGYALVDLHGLLQQVATAGIAIGGVTYTSAFITGGLFSLDGVHPDDLAHGVICNAMIDAVNAKFGSSLPRANLAELASNTSSAQRLARVEPGTLPLIRDAEAVYRSCFPWR